MGTRHQGVKGTRQFRSDARLQVGGGRMGKDPGTQQIMVIACQIQSPKGGLKLLDKLWVQDQGREDQRFAQQFVHRMALRQL